MISQLIFAHLLHYTIVDFLFNSSAFVNPKYFYTQNDDIADNTRWNNSHVLLFVISE